MKDKTLYIPTPDPLFLPLPRITAMKESLCYIHLDLFLCAYIYMNLCIRKHSLVFSYINYNLPYNFLWFFKICHNSVSNIFTFESIKIDLFLLRNYSTIHKKDIAMVWFSKICNHNSQDSSKSRIIRCQLQCSLLLKLVFNNIVYRHAV